MTSRQHDYLTIVAVYGHHDGASAIPALVHSLRELPGSRGLLISIARPALLPAGIDWKPIAGMDYRQYSVFMMYCLTHFIDTDYVLVVQDDGWVLDGANWRDEYLNYDYIGAPGHAAIVGNVIMTRFEWVGRDHPLILQNGGFSLRSRKFLRAAGVHGIMYHFQEQWPIPYEDVQLTGLFRPQLESLGIRFAPDELARDFSVEYFGPGFHDRTRFEDLFGHHGQSRKLREGMRIECSLTSDLAAKVYREADFMDFLESRGYAVEYTGKAVQDPQYLPSDGMSGLSVSS